MTQTQQDLRPFQWITGADTGISSRTLWAAMTGVQGGRFDQPYDPADLGRCIRLIELMPEWESRLDEVPLVCPKWQWVVEHWEELKALYYEELSEGTGLAPRLYQRMLELRDESGGVTIRRET